MAPKKDQEIQNKILLYLNKILFTQRLTIESRTSSIHIYMYVFIYAVHIMHVCMFVCTYVFLYTCSAFSSIRSRAKTITIG